MKTNSEDIKNLIRSLIRHNKNILDLLNTDNTELRAELYILVTAINEQFYRCFEYVGSMEDPIARSKAIEEIKKKFSDENIEKQLELGVEMEDSLDAVMMPNSNGELPEA
jgi:hypothetical protein